MEMKWEKESVHVKKELINYKLLQINYKLVTNYNIDCWMDCFLSDITMAAGG